MNCLTYNVRKLLQMFLLGSLLLCCAWSASAKSTIEIAKPEIDHTYSGQSYLDVEATVLDPRGISAVEILLNGNALDRHGTRNIELRQRILPTLKQLEGVTKFPIEFRIPVQVLREPRNRLTLRVVNVLGEVTTAQRQFRYLKAKGTIYVAAIGINQYQQQSIPDLKYAEDDARAVAAYFRDEVGVPTENVYTLLGEEATEENIEKLLGVTLQRKAGENDQVIIYYAGHGVPEFDRSIASPDQVEKYLLPWDGELDALYATAIPMHDVDRLFNRLTSERVVFMLDACFSGAANVRNGRSRTLSNRLKGRRAASLDDSFLSRIAEGKGKVILTASGINEPSQELDSLGHGVFTYFLLEGMKGRADFDADGVVSVTEIHKYLSDKVPALTDQAQRPTYFINTTVTGEIVLGRSSQADFKFNFRDPWTETGDFGRLILQVSPADSEIYIDGFYRGSGFINTLVRAGRRQIKILRPGYEPDERFVEIRQRKLSQFNLTLDANLGRRVITHSPPPP